MWDQAINWLESHFLKCYFVESIGVICPGCGMQRSFIALLKGDIVESMALFPALMPLIFMLSFLPLHLAFNFRHGASILKYTFIFTATLIILNYVYKLVT